MSALPQAGKRKSRPLNVEALSRELAALPVVPPAPRHNAKRDLIEQLREPLLEAVRRHHTLKALAAFLRERGVDIHPTTLRRYLGPVRAARAPSPGG